MATGWKPYSIVSTHEDGSKTYFPMGRFDPVGTVFGIVADIVDHMVLHPDAKETEGAIAAVALALAQNFQEKSFLMNFNQLIRAMSDPDTNLTKFLGNIAGSTIPGSSALKGYVNQDPYLRDARGFVDNMLKNMPGFSETLPPQRDAFGEPIWRRIGLTTTQSSDVVEDEHNRIIETVGKGITAPSHMRSGVDLRDVILEDGTPAFDRLQELSMKPTSRGLSLKDALAKLIQSEKYEMLVDGDAGTKGTKLWAFAGIVSKYRQVAYKVLLKENPQVRDAVMEKQLLVRSKLLNKREENSIDNGAQQILDAVGIKQ